MLLKNLETKTQRLDEEIFLNRSIDLERNIFLQENEDLNYKIFMLSKENEHMSSELHLLKGDLKELTNLDFVTIINLEKQFAQCLINIKNCKIKVL